MPFRPRKVYVVSHTHWDREWYHTFHTFRIHLAKVVKKVLHALETDPDYRHFLLDGQCIVLEDYLEVHPEDEGRIRTLVEAGALSIGPWYMLPDEFLISAESHVRNLLIGHAVGARFGGVQKVGYMPDSFGHIAQVPQLLRKAGMDAFVYTRGNGDEIERTGHEYFWEAPDGSTVLAINQPGGYCNGAGLGFDEIWHAHTRRTVKMERAVEQMTELFDKMEALSQGDVVLLNNGCDHFPPQQEFGAVMNTLREAFPDTEFEHTDLATYLAEVRAAGFVKNRFRGELAAGKLHHILSGVWSARMPLKQRNAASQVLVASQLEPLTAYSHFLHARAYPHGAITYCWKTLLQNHPHDSICGCSTDAVHRDMLPRFDGVDQTAERLLVEELEHWAPTFARDADDDHATVLCVANGLAERRQAVVDRLVVLQPSGVDAKDLRLLAPDGREVPFTIVRSWTVERFWGVDYRTYLTFEPQDALFAGYRRDFVDRILKPDSQRDEFDTFLHVQFVAELPAVGHVNYRLTTAAPLAPALEIGEMTASAEGPIALLRNDHVAVALYPDGTFDVSHAGTGQLYRGLNLFEDTEDIGDEYDYSPAEEGGTVTSAGITGTLALLETTPFAATAEASFDLEVPACIRADRRGRSLDAVVCPVRVQVRLTADSPRVDVMVCVDNQAEDHRLRVHFPALAQTDTVISDGHFYANERPVQPPLGEDWCQPHPGTYPQQDFSLMSDGKSGVAILVDGLPEIEAQMDGAGSAGLALTLLRSVGWLSRDDFPTRRHSNAGPTIATPEAQCLGPQTFRYAVLPFAGDWVDAGVSFAAQEFLTPPLVVQGVEDQSQQGQDGLVEVLSGKTRVTAVKRHETRDTLVVRLFNLTGKTVVEQLRFGRDIASVHRTNLLEEREDELVTLSIREVEFDVEPHAIETLEIAFVSG